jgi:hypothetical protein
MNETFRKGIYWCEKISKKQADRILHRLYKRIKDREVNIILRKEIHPWCGIWHTETGTIILNPRQPMVATFVHEYLHILFPDKPERWVYAMCIQLRELWTNRQWENLFRVVSELVRLEPVKIDISETLKDIGGHPKYDGEEKILKIFRNPHPCVYPV